MTAAGDRPAADAIAAVPGVPEAAVSAATLAALPATSPPAPWTLALEGVVWLHRAARPAVGAHQRGVSYDRSVPVTVGGFVRYLGSPVGAYAEVWGSPTVLVRGRAIALGVPFMAVDSPASLRGGRSLWALPKSLASITCEHRDGHPSAFCALGEDTAWSVAAQVASIGVRVPLAVAGHLLQATADGDQRLSPATARGVGRLARVQVQATGPSLPGWLTSGRHLGVVIERATMVLGVAGR